jgi:cytochrome P450
VGTSDPATALLHDPSTYLTGPPLDELARLRDEHPVVRVDEPAAAGAPPGPGYWLVLRHADVQRVMGDPETFSSALGGTQIRDPAGQDDLRYVRRMMLNMDPPEHARLRRPLTRARSPR